MIDGTVVSGVVFAGAVLGSFGRAMFPYLRKLKEQEDVEAEAGATTEKPIKFQRKYVYSAVFSAIVSLIVGMTLFPGLVESAMTSVQEIQITNGTATTETVEVTEGDEQPTTTQVVNTGLAGIFMTAFLTAWGTSSIVNNIIATGRDTSENVQPAPITKPGEGGTTTAK